jgi:undecaprenyl diphosphate synthase
MNVPAHIAVIMDGNGRWAKKRQLPRLAGHKAGMEAVRACVKACQAQGVHYLTLYAFSSENWKRPADEVKGLMLLLTTYLNKEITELHEQNVQMKFIGVRTGLSKNIQDLLQKSEEKTKNNKGLTLVIALNYGSRTEIVNAAQALGRKVASGEISANNISEADFTDQLDTKDIPDPDLIIRTSGEKRLSNFLLWQSAYAEFVFMEDYWPDFNAETLKAAIEEYQTRERRYGASD